MNLHYTVSIHDAAAHEYAVCLRIDEPDATGQLLTLPAWIPGSYMIRDFARNIVAIAAYDEAGSVALEKRDKQTWQAAPAQGRLRVEYRVYAWDLSVRAACLDPTRAYFNGPSVFLRVAGAERDACDVTLEASSATAGWRVDTTLPPVDVDANGFGTYRAADYEALIDHPVEMGRQHRFEFTVEGVPHACATSEAGRFDAARLQEDLERICAEHVGMFGDLPVERYLFMTLALGEGYGGLEHRDSTSLMCNRSDLPPPGMRKVTKGYRQFMALCSHEYFHLWNVKRIRPARLAESRLEVEAYTELLWAFEGITSYYDELALLRAGCLSLDEYLDLFATTVTRVMRGGGRRRQSIAESSFDAWTKFYRQDENAPNAIVSYYAKGALVAFGLDVTLRLRSMDTLCLDDLMRDLWQVYGRSGEGVPERGIERRVEQLLGEPLDGFFADYVYGTRELPLADWFAALGIDYRLAPARDESDQGGLAGDTPDSTAPPVLGARLADAGGRLQVTHVLHGGAAHQAGVAAGDILLALGGERLTQQRLPDLLGRYAAGDAPELHLFRRDRLLTLALPIIEAPADTCRLGRMTDVEPAVATRHASWRATRSRPGA